MLIPTVLLVDDSTADLRLLMEIIASRQIRLIVAFDGASGYNKAMMHRPDLILLDVCMPGLDGFNLCQMLKANTQTRHIPVIFLTAADDLDQRLHGLRIGGVDYIVKPFHEEEVLARMAIHLELARQINQQRDKLPSVKLDESSAPASRSHVLVQAACQQLRHNMATPPSPQELAHRLGTNEKRLTQAFQEVFTLSVYAWLREERLRQGRDLVTSTHTPLADIACHLGYSSPAHFSKAFHDRFGQTPRDMRRQRQAGDCPNDYANPVP
jgi:DNA-binding response OmpR family regulator